MPYVQQEIILKDQVIQFLTRLNDHLFVVKTKVLLMESLPSINNIYSLIAQEKINIFHANIFDK